MGQRVRAVLFATAVALVLLPGVAWAQNGSIAGTARDAQGGVLPGVTVEVSSPQLIEKVRSTVTDDNGRYQIAALPVGVYKVTFTLSSFGTVERTNVELSSDFTATVNADMKIGTQTETITVTGTAAVVDVQNARQRQVFSSEELRDLPTTRNLPSLVQLVPGIAMTFGAGSVPDICSGGAADGTSSGGLSGCSPILTGFNAHASGNDLDGLNQGRIQVDGLGIQSFAGGGRSSYIPDVANSQEIAFTLSGSLGESETGGTTINIVPRTGGNRYAGNYFTAYSNGHFFGKNDGSRRAANGASLFTNRLDREYDANASFGGPVIRDRLWFYSTIRRQDRQSLLLNAYRNLNEGIFGANYRRSDVRVMSNDQYQNAATRLTVQASQRNKLNVFWDQQRTCENPCEGTGVGVSVEASASPLSSPVHVAQLSWTNPLTNKILLDAAFSHYSSHYDQTRSLGEKAYPSIPRVTETGTVDIPAAGGTSIVTGSLNNAIYWNNDNFQSRASGSYITGSHNIKVGYQGQILTQKSTPHFNDLRLAYSYTTPTATCVPTPPTLDNVTAPTTQNPTWCGLFPDGRRIYDGLMPSDPLGAILPQGARVAVPNTVTQYLPSQTDQKAWFSSLYLQDQWTLNRFTLSGALRYDNAQSSYGKTCVGPDLYTTSQYCLNDRDAGDSGKGVNFHDITPRVGVSWDVFGTGKTALKFSLGKYLAGSGITGIYTASNPASGGRSVNSYTRIWRDLDNDRIVDCDLMIPATAPAAGSSLPTNGECGGESTGNTNNARRFGRSPDALDDLGLAVGLDTIYCGQDEPSMSQQIRNYCNNYFASGGTTLLTGWGKRAYEWQTSIGVQHELLPRLSVEVTYNRREDGNQTATDLIGIGCDLYSSQAGGTVDSAGCMSDLLNLQSPFYDFYSIQAPVDPRLPGGGGYRVPGFATLKQTGVNANGTPVYLTIPASTLNAVTIAPKGSIIEYWSGVDTNFTLRARGGLRVSGGTSTGRAVSNSCALQINGNPPTGQILDAGFERRCDLVRPFQTNVRGSASYTIPWLDVLASTVVTYRPGVTINANYTVALADLAFEPGTQRFTTALSGNTTGTVTQNLLSNDTFGEGIRIIDFKLAKNIRFKGKRINLGADVYNVFNSDAALGYCATYPNPAQGIEGCGTSANNNLIPWGTVNAITSPRYARFQLQVDF